MAVERVSELSADASAWLPVTSGQAQLALSSASVGGLPALRMDFDFKGGGGFVVARRMVHRAMHEDYAVSLRLRGRGPVNDLELKLIDTTGQNVWRYVKKDLHPPARWKSMRIDSREIEFAWGPASGGVLTELGAIEIAIVAREGGRRDLMGQRSQDRGLQPRRWRDRERFERAAGLRCQPGTRRHRVDAAL